MNKKQKRKNQTKPYGFLKQVGVSTKGMTPREAWSLWSEIKKAARSKANKPKSKKKPAVATQKAPKKVQPSPMKRRTAAKSRTTKQYRQLSMF